MKKLLAFLLVVFICAGMSGCDMWLSGSYSSVTPHPQEDGPNTDTDQEITSYAQLQDRLCDMAASGSEGGILYFSTFHAGRMEAFVKDAIAYVKTQDPIGAYAVSEITYEIGTNAGRHAVAVTITYVHSRAEILRIRRLTNMQDALQAIYAGLEKYDAGLVLRVDQYEDVDFTQLVQDYVEQNPDKCMEMPQVSATVYPETGQQRVVELSFSYQTSRETLRQMQQKVEPVFDSAELYVTGDADIWRKYFQLYSFLMERDNYTVETSITPSYSLLQHGVGDSKAFATVYAAMCRRAGLDCQVVSGTRSGSAWYWNVILSDGEYYYLDLLRCSQNGRFRVRTQQEMSGYVWDYSQYQQAPAEQQ